MITPTPITTPDVSQKQTYQQNNNRKTSVIASCIGIGAGILCYKKSNNLIKLGKKICNVITSLFNKKHTKPSNNIFTTNPPTVFNIGPNLRTKISNKIQEYLNKNIGKEIDPAKLDEILTKLAGKNNTVELNFYENPLIGVTKGRKKAYRFKDGTEIHLECHTSRHGTVTRVYDAKKNGAAVGKPDRSYLHPDGTFSENAYLKGNAHLQSGETGEAWISNAPPFNKIA